MKNLVKVSLATAVALALTIGGFSIWLVTEGNRRVKPRPREVTFHGDPVRGRYLIENACVRCHGEDLTGGKEVPSPLGRTWASNITGLGRWSDGQLEEALRRGVEPFGRVLIAPVFDGLSDDDTAAIVAHLKTIPRKDKPSHPPELTWAGRFSIAAGDAPVSAGVIPGVVAPPAGTREQGEYLAESVLGCAECHHPRERGVPAAGRLWAGGSRLEEPTPVLASNLTPDPVEGIGSWSATDFLRALREGKAPSGRVLHAAMPRYAGLTESDARAIFEHLRGVKPVREHVLSREALRGSDLYRSVGCVSCHGVDGRGPRADIRALGKAGDQAEIERWIRDPASKKPGTLMPRLDLKDDERAAIARFVIEISKR